MLIGKKAPEFKAKIVEKNEIKEICLQDIKNKYIVLFFYPADFTFVCPTELHAFQEKIEEFQSRNVELLGCSVDNVYSHLAWLDLPKSKGGIQGVCYPLISDLGGEIAKQYGVLNEENVAYRGLFILDKNQIIRSCCVNDLPLGRNIDEVLRLIDALQFHEKNGQVCPANWNKTKEAIDTTLESVSDYLQKN